MDLHLIPPLSSSSFSKSLLLDSGTWKVWLVHLPIFPEYWGKKIWIPQPFFMSVIARALISLMWECVCVWVCVGGYNFFYLLLLTYIFEEIFLVIYYISSQAKLHPCLGFPDPLPVLLSHNPVIFPGGISLPMLLIFVPYFSKRSCLTMIVFCLTFLTSYIWNRELLCPKKNVFNVTLFLTSMWTSWFRFITL